MKKISLIINTYNRASVLDETLSSLYYLEYPNFEVIVINGPSTDNTEEILEKYKKDIKIARTIERNLSISRNIGIALASGEYVAFIDDDAIPDRKWLNKIIKAFNNPEVAGAGGDVYNVTGIEYQARRLLSDRFGSSNNNYQGNSPSAIPNAPKFISTMGVNSIYIREVLLEIGGYDEQFDYFLDETDLCSRIVDAGYYINYVEGADVYHKFATSFMRGEEKVPLDYSSIIKNIIYYCYQYKNIATENTIQETISNIVSNCKLDIIDHYKKSLLSRTEYQNAKKSIDLGVFLGEQSIERGHKLLITEETLKKNKSDFKKFPNFSNKKTIVLLTHEYYPNIQGGIASLVHNFGLNLSKKGHNVHIITCDDHKYEKPTVTFENNIWVHRVKTKNYDLSFLRSKTNYDIDIQAENNHQLNKLYSVYEEICNISNKHKVDIVHNFLWENLNFYALGNEKFNCVTTLVTPASHVYTNSKNNYDHNFAIEIEKFCIENNPNLIGDSQCIIGYCKKYYNISEGKVIYLGLEDKSHKILNNKIIKDSNKIEILFLGRFEYRKGIDLLLTVIPNICKNYDNVVFRLVGNNTIKDPENNHKEYLNSFLKKHKNLVDDGKVIIEGTVDDTAIYYKNCDIFVAPSRFESFGLIYLEAMMFNKPTIGTNISAIPEVIENNVTGLLAEPENTDSLMNCLIELIGNKQLRESMGLKGRERYEKLFTSDIMTNNTLKYYEEIIAKRN